MKSYLGQFFTTNSKLILDGFEHYVKNKVIFDPYSGKGDLLDWALENGAASATGTDVDQNLIKNLPDDKKNIISFNDSLINIKKSEFILTNPPYVKTYLTNYQNDFENLYALAISKIIESDSDEGILIIPINFLSAERNKKIRELFFNKYKITKLTYFTKPMFVDTTINVIAFHFEKTSSVQKSLDMLCDGNIYNLSFNDFDIYNQDVENTKKQKNILNCTRVIDKHMVEGDFEIKASFETITNVNSIFVDKNTYEKVKSNILILSCADLVNKKINIDDIRKYDSDVLVSKQSQRTYASLFIDLPIDTQEKLIPIVNDTLENMRNETFSMFLSTFRDKNRKRISFDFFYQLINYCYFKYLK